MPKIRLLAIDVDGTLVNSRNELTPATRDALARAGQAGIRVVLATGRRYSRALPLVEPLGICVPLVVASGALVKDPSNHRTLYCFEFTAEVVRRSLEVAAGCGYDMLLCADTYAQGFDYYQPGSRPPSPELGEYLRLNPGCGRVWPASADASLGVFNGFTMGSQPQMLALQQQLHRRMPGLLHSHVLRVPRYAGYICEIFPAGVTKWSAVRRLAAGWGIGDDAICAVGDDVNDLPMIRAAGLGVAMGNALPAVKAAADRVVSSHDEDGLVEVVHWLLERPAAG